MSLRYYTVNNRLSLTMFHCCWAVFLITFSNSVFAGQSKSDSDKLTVTFFGSGTCGECLEIKETLLKPLQNQHQSRLDVKIFDTDKEDDFKMLVAMEKAYGVGTSSPQTLFLPDTFITGYADIMKFGRSFIESRLMNNSDIGSLPQIDKDTTNLTNILKGRFESFSFLSILAAGLVDGVNPCAIATMIFLVSFLATKKRRRSEILLVGLTYTFAVFVTYLLLGIGAFKAITTLSAYRWLSIGIKWSAVGFAGIIGGICIRDAIVFNRTGKASNISLQLPRALKLRIHSIISENLSGSRLLFGSAVAGFLVTLLEAVCTGQVYLPTIILMTRADGLQATGWLYLLFYNVLFVFPLLIVMVLAYFGLKWERLSKVLQQNMSALKVALGVVLISLAIYLAIMG